MKRAEEPAHRRAPTARGPGPSARYADPDRVPYSPPHTAAAPRTPAAWPRSLAAARGGSRAAPHHPPRRSGDSEWLPGANGTSRRQARARRGDAGSARPPRTPAFPGESRKPRHHKRRRDL
ncbi:hypothetical protein ACRRTK_008607 [Alexandromys fortis]